MDPCSSCAAVHFAERRVHRNGSLAVVLGHSLLVPSFLIVILASMGVVDRPALTSARSPEASLVDAGIPDQVIERVSSRQPVADSELGSLTQDQRECVLRAQMQLADESVRESMLRFTSSDAFRLLVSLALASGVLGWYLTRKKSVAQCINCGSSTDV